MADLYEYIGADPRDYFDRGRVAPGDVVEGPVPDDGCWQPANGQLPAPPPATGGATPPAAPVAAEEV